MIPTESSGREPLADITINSLGGLGDGIGTHNDKPIFVEKAVAGDRLRVRIVHQTKEALRGEIVEVLEGGPERVSAACPHFSACGGCGLQQLQEPSYHGFKRKILRDALAHGGFADVPADVTFLPAASRRRVELKVSHDKASLRFAYYASRTRDLVPIENCLILEPQLQALLEPLSKALVKWHAVRAIKTVSLTRADSGIDMVLEVSSPVEDTAAISRLADILDIGRISLSIPGQPLTVVAARTPITMRLGAYDIALGAGSFLQASSEGQRLLTEAVVAGVTGAKSIADLFCGIGTYSFPLSKSAKVHAVESDAAMVKNLKTMIHLQGLNRAMSAEQRDLFMAPLNAKELDRFDAVVLNPPRAGAKAQVLQLAQSKVPVVFMVSCSPSSFARDAKALKAAGFAITSAGAIDQFVYSPHLEIVARFAR